MLSINARMSSIHLRNAMKSHLTSKFHTRSTMREARCVSEERITNPVIGVTTATLIIKDSVVKATNNMMLATPLITIIAGPGTEGTHRLTTYQNTTSKI